MENLNPSVGSKTKNKTLEVILGWLVGAVFVLSGVALIFTEFVPGIFFFLAGLLLIKPAREFLFSKLHVNLNRKVKIGLVIVFAIIAGFTVDTKPVADVATQQEVKPVPVVTQPVAEKEVAPVIPKTTQQILEENLTGIVKKTGSTNFVYKGIEIEKADSDRPAGSKMITVKVSVSDFYSKSSLTKDTGRLSAQIFQQVFSAEKNTYDAFVWFTGETTDRYGNKNESPVMTYAIDKTTYNKINWSNFDPSKLCDFLAQEEKLVGVGSGPACNVIANIQ